MKPRMLSHFVKQKEISGMLTLSERTSAFDWCRTVLWFFILVAWAFPAAGQSPATQANVVTTFSPPYTVPLSEIYASQQLNVIVRSEERRVGKEGGRRWERQDAERK